VASLIELVLLLRLNEPDWHNQSQLILLLGFEVRVLFFIGEYFCSGVNMAKVCGWNTVFLKKVCGEKKFACFGKWEFLKNDC
jgi:hypothetical protein